MNYRDIEYETTAQVARIWHNRPSARNAESRQLLDELDDAVRRAIADEEVRVIILAGRGEHFSAGHDLKEAQASRAGFTVEERYAYEERSYYEYALRIWDAPKPTIAQVQGACIAGGFMVANMCDLIVASEDAFFSDPVCRTLGVAAAEVLVHPWVMSLRKAKEFLYTGRRIGAAEALQIGMVNRVTPRAELESAALALAQEVAQTPAFALKLIKRSLHRALDMQGFRTALAAHFDTHQLSHLSQGFADARAAGLSKSIERAKSG